MCDSVSMSLSLVHFCKQQALEFLYWCHHQHRQMSLALAARTVTEVSKDDVVCVPVCDGEIGIERDRSHCRH